MADPDREHVEKPSPEQRSVWPFGFIVGVIVGVAVGFVRGDAATSAGTAVALGITFAFLSPLVRDLLTKKKSGDAVHSDDNASKQENFK
ncbi:MAG: hypothetical protein ACXIVL_06015 [Oceanicaulis sp.]